MFFYKGYPSGAYIRLNDLEISFRLHSFRIQKRVSSPSPVRQWKDFHWRFSIAFPRLSESRLRESVTDAYIYQQLNWQFIPLGAPHMGGLWEVGVKSFKTLLYKSPATRMYTLQELSTLLAKIEACLNSRPLPPMSEDPASVEPRSLSCRWTSSVHVGTRSKGRIQIYYKPVTTLKGSPSPILCSIEGRVP